MRLHLLSPCSVSNSGPGTWPVVTFEHFSASLWPSRRYLDLQMGGAGAQRGKILCTQPWAPRAWSLHPPVGLRGLCQALPPAWQRGSLLCPSFSFSGRPLCHALRFVVREKERLHLAAHIPPAKSFKYPGDRGWVTYPLHGSVLWSGEWRWYYPCHRVVRINWYNGCEELFKNTVQNIILCSW